MESSNRADPPAGVAPSQDTRAANAPQNMDVGWLTGEFADPKLEHDFRESVLHEDVRKLRALLGVVVVIVFAFVINDLLLGTDAQRFGLIFAMRLLFTAVFLSLFVVFWSAKRYRTVQFAVYVFMATLGILEVGIDLTRPAYYFGHLGTDVLIVMGYYLLMPVSVRVLATAGGTMTFVLIGIHVVFKDSAGTLYHLAVPVALITANVLGLIGASTLNRSRRAQYLQTMLLEEALANVRTLSGLVPICSHCKKIRDDDGFWQHVETYVSEHSLATFSHGICPDCRETNY